MTPSQLLASSQAAGPCVILVRGCVKYPEHEFLNIYKTWRLIRNILIKEMWGEGVSGTTPAVGDPRDHPYVWWVTERPHRPHDTVVLMVKVYHGHTLLLRLRRHTASAASSGCENAMHVRWCFPRKPIGDGCLLSASHTDTCYLATTQVPGFQKQSRCSS